MFRTDSIAVLIVESSLLKLHVLARLSVHGILNTELVKEAFKSFKQSRVNYYVNYYGIALCQGLLP